jgi:ribosomal protein L13E
LEINFFIPNFAAAKMRHLFLYNHNSNMNSTYNKRPLVKSGAKMREGKGFSLNELKQAGLTILDARRIGIYIDSRRKSVNSQNVEYLKTIELKKK